RLRDRRDEILFVDARKLGRMVDRTRKELSEEDIERIARTYHAWRGEADAGGYEDVPGFCRAATLDEVRVQAHVLTPGRYVGSAEMNDDDGPFADRFAGLTEKLRGHFAEAEALSVRITQ